jgi:hypothetical protein
MSSTPPSSSTSQVANYDTPWKIAIEQHFRQFIAFYFPAAHEEIDWDGGYEFLDKELQAITKDALVGTRHVDKLVKVMHRSGHERWLLVHIEVQMSRQAQFAERMFIYNYRIFDRYHHPVASLAVLGDDDPRWLPQEFGYAALGSRMAFHFPVAKLASYASQQATLADNPNPFALLTLAYLQNRATSTDMQARFDVKCQVIRMLHARKWEKEFIRSFFLVIDWMMVLPAELAVQLSEFVSELEKEQEMEYVSSVERVIIERHRREQARETETAMLCRLLNCRFGPLPATVQEQINNASQEQVEAWFDCAAKALTLHEIFPDLAH